MKAVDEYLNFLWQQFQYDWSWMSNPWVLYPVIPIILYLIFFTIKWIVLLTPITLPIMVYRWSAKKADENNKNSQSNNFFKN